MSRLTQRSQYATQAEHDAALDATYAMERRRGIPVAALVPPRKLYPDELFAMAALGLPPSGIEGWLREETHRADARTPWRMQDRGEALRRGALPLGDYRIEAMGMLKGCRVELHRPVWTPGITTPTIAVHTLVRASSGRVHPFGGQRAATEWIESVIMADGALPAKWAWEPLLPLSAGCWTPSVSPLDWRIPYVPEVTWRGATAKWTVTQTAGSFYTQRNHKVVCDPSGVPRAFGSAFAAKAYCEMADRP